MTAKLRIKFDYVKKFWRHTGGSLKGRHVTLCRFCRQFAERKGTCAACQTLRNAEIKTQRRAFTNARRSGKIASLADGKTPCVDCAGSSPQNRRPAIQWDHRDWREPLKVEPVCSFHNARRGRAMTAYEASFVNLRLRRRPFGIDPIGFLATPAQAINLIRHPSYDSFQPVEAIEQGGEFEGVDPLHDVPFCIAPLVDL